MQPGLEKLSGSPALSGVDEREQQRLLNDLPLSRRAAHSEQLRHDLAEDLDSSGPAVFEPCLEPVAGLRSTITSVGGS
jgi:hypothetical protein